MASSEAHRRDSQVTIPAVGRRAVLAALVANVAVGLTKLMGFLITGSSSLLAETFHSLADAGNQGLLLLGARKASEPPSPLHPFGRGRERYFWAFIVALVLFGLGGVFSMYEGIRKLSTGGHELTRPGVAFALLGVALCVEAASLRTGIREAEGIRPTGQSWWRFVRTTRNPEVSVVLLEDGAAIVGLTIAMVGVTGSWLTGSPVSDGVASVLIGVLLCFVAALLTMEMKSLLIGETISEETEGALVAELEALDGVDRVLNFRTEHLGPDQVLVCTKIAISEPADLNRVVEVINSVERHVMVVLPETLTCYVEPDMYDPARVDSPWT